MSTGPCAQSRSNFPHLPEKESNALEVPPPPTQWWSGGDLTERDAFSCEPWHLGCTCPEETRCIETTFRGQNVFLAAASCKVLARQANVVRILNSDECVMQRTKDIFVQSSSRWAQEEVAVNPEVAYVIEAFRCHLMLCEGTCWFGSGLGIAHPFDKLCHWEGKVQYMEQQA